MSNEKIWCGSGVEKFDGDMVAVSICLTDIPKEHIQKANNGKSYINLNVGRKREVDQYGKTHGVSVNTWKPDGQKSTPKIDVMDDLTSEELPF